MGFYSFILGLVVFLFCIGDWVRRNGIWAVIKQVIPLLVISLLLYLTHMISLIMGIAVIGIMTVLPRHSRIIGSPFEVEELA